jgi:hypothetical protein
VNTCYSRQCARRRDHGWRRRFRQTEPAQAAVVARMKEYLPTGELQFLMELSIEPVAAQLGLVSAPD